MIAPEVAKFLPEIRDLCRHYAVERMHLIGSATDEKKFLPERSDLDCLVKFANEDDHLYERFLALGEALEKACHRPVEIVFESALQNELFRDIVEQSAVLVYDVSHVS
jgi:predicted nucleotidyltransferase